MSDADIAKAQQQLGKALERARAGEDKELAAQVREKGEQLTRLLTGVLRMTRIHDLRNAAFNAPIRDLAATLGGLYDLLGMVQVVMVEDQVYVNDIRMRFDMRSDAVTGLAAIWLPHEVGGVTFHNALTEEHFRSLVTLVAAEPAEKAPRAALQAAFGQRGLGGVELQPLFRFRVGGEAMAFGQHDVQEVYARAASAVGELWDHLSVGRSPNPLPLRRMVTELVELDPGAQEEEVVATTRDVRSPAHNRHSVQVATLSVMLGRELGLPEVTLSDLGVAACFHDLGYTADEDGYPPPFERHGSAGVRILLQQRGFHEARIRRVLVCLQHHRRHDDPRRATLFSRIIHIADDYDTLTRYRPSGPLLAPPDVVARMYAARGTLYDPHLMQLFVNRVGPYPPGSILELATGRWVMVLSGVRRPELFAKPLTLVVRNADGSRPPEDTQFDLARGDAVRSIVRMETPP